MAEKSGVKIFGSEGSTANKVAEFQQKMGDGNKKVNPSTDWEMSRLKARDKSYSFDKGDPRSVDKGDPRYGRPPEGSKTEKRGKQAGNLVSNEIRFLCDLISEHGELQEDGSTVISFGELFQMYTRISNKVVGILMRARKYGLLQFEGEMLYQKRDDDVLITMHKPIEELRAMFESEDGLKEAGEAFAPAMLPVK